MKKCQRAVFTKERQGYGIGTSKSMDMEKESRRWCDFRKNAVGKRQKKKIKPSD